MVETMVTITLNAINLPNILSSEESFDSQRPCGITSEGRVRYSDDIRTCQVPITCQKKYGRHLRILPVVKYAD